MNYAHEGGDTSSPPIKTADIPASYSRRSSRSKPVRITPVRLKSGRTIFRVTGTLQRRGRQQKRIFSTLEEAQACAENWERVRAGDQSMLRARFTRLDENEVSDAEVALFLLRGSGLGLAEAVRRYLAGQIATTTKPSPSALLEDAVKAFLTYHTEKQTSAGQRENYRTILLALTKAAGAKTAVDKVTTAQIEDVLKKGRGRDGGPISKKTWNIYRGDLAAFFTWCAARPRSWLRKEEDPVEPVKRYTKREMPRPLPERLEVSVCRELMGWLEKHEPEWCCYFAVALFAGVRPDMVDGEMAKLAEAVAEHGAGKFFANGVLHLPATITKDRRHRQTTLPPNLLAWLAKYPPTAETLNPKSHFRCAKIRKRFAIGHDVLRHTAISAFVCSGKGIEAAALEFGNSERVIRSNYLNRFSTEEAKALYDIFPSK